MQVSICITTYNEEKHIERLLESIVCQTITPYEVIIVDGGSSDKTVAKIKKYQSKIKNLLVFTKKGNRPYGRNESIKIAKGDIIAITDAGCELDKNWLKEITNPFTDEEIEVVSGYYAGKPQNVFESTLVPYVLVMPDRVDFHHFLPSTRSMAMRKSIWKNLAGFPEKYRWNEDYVFSKQLEKKHISIKFVQNAIVYWFPRETIFDGYMMFYSFAKGDTQAGIWRMKVVFLIFRSLFVFGLLSFTLLTKNYALFGVFTILVILYCLWAVLKNYRYIQKPSAIIYLPIWQITSDIAVCVGSIRGTIDRYTGNFH